MSTLMTACYLFGCLCYILAFALPLPWPLVILVAFGVGTLGFGAAVLLALRLQRRQRPRATFYGLSYRALYPEALYHARTRKYAARPLTWKEPV